MDLATARAHSLIFSLDFRSFSFLQARSAIFFSVFREFFVGMRATKAPNNISEFSIYFALFFFGLCQFPFHFLFVYLGGAGVYDRPQVGPPGVFALPPAGWPRSQMFSHLPQCCESCAFMVSSRLRAKSLRCATPQARRKWATAIFGGGVRAFQCRRSIV